MNGSKLTGCRVSTLRLHIAEESYRVVPRVRSFFALPRKNALIKGNSCTRAFYLNAHIPLSSSHSRPPLSLSLVLPLLPLSFIHR